LFDFYTEDIYLYGSVLLILVLVVLKALSSNQWIKDRLKWPVILLAVSVVISVVIIFRPDTPHLPTARLLLIVMAAVIAIVVLAFNEFRGHGVSERYPSIVQDAIVIGGFIIIAVGLAPRELLTPSAVGALIVGLALQDTLGNLFSGLALQIEKPLMVGNWVKVADTEGKVSEITWRATKIRTKEGHICVIPNTMIARDPIINYSHPSPVIRREITIGFGYESHPNKVKKCVLDTLAQVPNILRMPEPTLILEKYNDFSIDYRIRFWIKDFSTCERILDSFTTLLYYTMKREGLTIPFPIEEQRVSQEQNAEELVALELKRKQHFVDKLDLFAELEEADRAMIAECLDEVTFAENESIVKQGDSGDSMYIIRNGEVKVILEKYGQVKEVAQIRQGDYFGEMALLTGEKRTATITAKTDTDVFILRKEAFSEVLLSNSAIANIIADKVSKRSAALESDLLQFSDVSDVPTANRATLLKKMQLFFKLANKSVE
jgi:small-conductance mechanosensitive channel/CRP-like cAMP-binding protein